MFLNDNSQPIKSGFCRVNCHGFHQDLTGILSKSDEENITSDVPKMRSLTRVYSAFLKDQLSGPTGPKLCRKAVNLGTGVIFSRYEAINFHNLEDSCP